MKNQRGMALIIVLLLLSIMAAVMVNTTQQGLLARERIYSGQQHIAQKWLLYGAEQWLLLQLNEQQIAVDSNWHSVQLDEHAFIYQLKPMQPCFNLNALIADESDSPSASDENGKRQATADPEKIAVVQTESTGNEAQTADTRLFPARVFHQLLINGGMAPAEAEILTLAVRRHFSTDDHRVSPLRHVSELHSISGWRPEVWQRVAPLLCIATDRQLQVALNDFSAEQSPLLSALLLGTLSVEQATAWLENRPIAGWQGTDDLISAYLPAEQAQAFTRLQPLLKWRPDMLELRLRLDNEDSFLIHRVQLRQQQKQWSVISRYTGW